MVVDKGKEFKEFEEYKEYEEYEETAPPDSSTELLYRLLPICLGALDRAASWPRVRIASEKRGEKACPQLIRKQLR